MATKYWRVGGTNLWSSTANWSTDSPTGATGAPIPVVGDDVVISNVGQTAGTINIGATATAKLNSWTVIGGTWTVAGATQVNIAGTFDCRNVTWTNTGLLSLQGSGATYDINTSGTTFSCGITFNALNVAGSAFNLLAALTTSATQTTTLTAGTLILNNFTLTTGIFSSSANTREIQFGTGNIALIHTTAASTVLALSNYSGFTWTGTGGFTSAMSVTRTFSVGSTGATNTTSVNLALTSGASVPTFTAGGWFNHLNFAGSSFTLAAVSLNVNSLTLASGGTYTALTITAIGTGTITPAGKSLAAFTVNHTGTTTLNAALSTVVTGITTLTLGTLDLAGFTLTTGTFVSSNSNTRAIAFGTGNINLTHTTLGTTVLSMATATAFTWTGTGGFTVADMSNTRTFTFGTTGGTTTNAPNLTFTTGASVATITTAGWFNKLDFGTTAFTHAASTLNVTSLTLSSTGTYTALTATMVGTGTITSNGKSTGPLIINNGAGTTTLSAAALCTTYTQTAGTINFATFNLTCSGAVAYTSGTLNNIGTITCTTWTVTGTFTLTQGTITPSTSFVLTSGAFNYNGGTLSAVPTFTHTAGTATFNVSYALTATSTYTLSAGTLTLADAVTLSTGAFVSTTSFTRSIAFGSASAGNINLRHTTAATTVLSMATVTGFTWTGPGGFTVADMAVTRTFSFGSTAGGTTTNAPNLTFTTGASVATITTAGWFNKLDFGTTAFTHAASTLNVTSLTLSSTGTYTALILNVVGSGTLTYNGKTTAAFTVNHAGTTTVAGTGINCTTFTIAAGTIDFATFSLTCTNALTGNTDLFGPAGTVNLTTITCPTYTVNGTLTITSGQSLTTTTSFVTATAFTYAGGTFTTPLFTHTSGTVTFNSSNSLAVTGTYTLTAGTLTLADGVTLTTGIFSSSNTNTRAIAFGSASAGNINLRHTTAATTVLQIADATNFSCTGPGGFTVADMAVTRTFSFGSTTATGTSATAPNLTFTTGASVATLTSNSWFNTLSYGTTSFIHAASTLNVNSLTLSSTGTYTALILNVVGSGTLTYNGKTTAAVTLLAGTTTVAGTANCTTFTVNGPTFNFTSGTLNPSTSFVLTSGAFTYNGGTLGAVPTFTQSYGTVIFNFSYSLAVTGTYTLTAGTLTLADGVTLTTGIFSSSNTNTRAIAFGSASAGNIHLTHTTAATTVLLMTTATGFSYTGPGGFTVANMANTRSFSFGNAGTGTAANAVNLTFTTGASIATFTSTGVLNSVNFGTTSFAPASFCPIYGSLTLSSTGTYTSMPVVAQGTGTITPNGKTIALLTINTTGTITLAGALIADGFVHTAGILDFATFNLTRVATTGMSLNGGTFTNMGTVTFTGVTIGNGSTFTFSSGTIACTNFTCGTSSPVAIGNFIYNGGTFSNLSASGISFYHYNGAVTLNASLNLNGSSVAIANSYSHTAGTLILNNFNLTVGSYINNNTVVGSPATEIQFGTGFIYVGITAAAVSPSFSSSLTIYTVWNFTNTGTGGFSLNLNVARAIHVFEDGTTGTSANAPLARPLLEQAFNVFVTSGSSQLYIGVNSRFKTLDFTGSSGTFFSNTGSTVYCQTLILGSAASYTGLVASGGQIVMNGAGSITSNGKTLGKITRTDAYESGAVTTLNDALTCSDRITINSGVISSAYNITALYFLAVAPASLNSSNNIYLTLTGNTSGAGASGVFQCPSYSSVLSAGITIYLTASTAKNFIGAGSTYPTLMQGGLGILTITGSNTFDTLTNNNDGGFSFEAGSTQTVTNFTVNGAGPLVTLTSTTPGTQYSLSKASGTVSVQYLSIRDSNATGGAAWYANLSSTDVSNNTGWIFTGVPPPSTVKGNFFLFF